MNDLSSLFSVMSEQYATQASMREKSLAKIVTALINENEPLLYAEQDGSTVIVRERGDINVMRFTVIDDANSEEQSDD